MMTLEVNLEGVLSENIVWGLLLRAYNESKNYAIPVEERQNACGAIMKMAGLYLGRAENPILIAPLSFFGEMIRVELGVPHQTGDWHGFDVDCREYWSDPNKKHRKEGDAVTRLNEFLQRKGFDMIPREELITWPEDLDLKDSDIIYDALLSLVAVVEKLTEAEFKERDASDDRLDFHKW